VSIGGRTGPACVAERDIAVPGSQALAERRRLVDEDLPGVGKFGLPGIRVNRKVAFPAVHAVGKRFLVRDAPAGASLRRRPAPALVLTHGRGFIPHVERGKCRSSTEHQPAPTDPATMQSSGRLKPWTTGRTVSRLIRTAHALACLRIDDVVTDAAARLAADLPGSALIGRVLHPYGDTRISRVHPSFLSSRCLVAPTSRCVHSLSRPGSATMPRSEPTRPCAFPRKRRERSWPAPSSRKRLRPTNVSAERRDLSRCRRASAGPYRRDRAHDRPRRTRCAHRSIRTQCLR